MLKQERWQNDLDKNAKGFAAEAWDKDWCFTYCNCGNEGNSLFVNMELQASGERDDAA